MAEGFAPDELLHDLRREIGARNCLDDAAARRVYAGDASRMEFGVPACVCLPRNAAEVAAIVGICRSHGTPYVARGAGTGLSGGALPASGAVVISLARLNHLSEVDVPGRAMQAGPGAANAAVGRHAARAGLVFAPDPGSRVTSTIGGNVAENAGGPHCLKLGVTAAHVRRLQWVDGRGRSILSDADLCGARGLDPARLLVGGEGTLGVVTRAELRLVPAPVAASTLLAFFDDLGAAARAVVDLAVSGLLPAAIEMVDGPMLALVEEAFAFGFPLARGGAMIVEFDGRRTEVSEDAQRAETVLTAAGAVDVRRARDDTERDELWKCRRHATAAAGRRAPNRLSLDVAVPLGELPAMVADIESIAADHHLSIVSVMHAGDGDLHPGVLHDARDPAQRDAARRAGDAVTEAALRRRGSASGEHGIGLEKLGALARQLDPAALRLMRSLKGLLDPEGLCNPGKAIPDHVPDESPDPFHEPPRSVRLDRESLVLTAPADHDWLDLQRRAARDGLHLPGGCGRDRMPAGRHLMNGPCGPALFSTAAFRDPVLEFWLRTGGGEAIHLGVPCLKDVAGYELIRLLLGTGDVLCEAVAASWALKPAPACIGVFTWDDVERRLLPAQLRDLLSADAPGGRGFARASDGRLTATAIGRDADWDLGELQARLEAWTTGRGLPAPTAERLSWSEALASTERLLPESGCWTALSRDGGDGWPVGLPADVPVAWQAYPEIVWVGATRFEAPPGWRADPVLADGAVQPPPPPSGTTPVDLLLGMKRILDPDGRLSCPDWLEMES